jgi:hypothetical protein
MEPLEEGETLRRKLWHQELRNHLIQQGVQGFIQPAILKYFRHRIDPDEVKGYLELLLKEDKVQKFRWDGHIWWRATTEILNDDV